MPTPIRLRPLHLLKKSAQRFTLHAFSPQPPATIRFRPPSLWKKMSATLYIACLFSSNARLHYVFKAFFVEKQRATLYVARFFPPNTRQKLGFDRLLLWIKARNALRCALFLTKHPPNTRIRPPSLLKKSAQRFRLRAFSPQMPTPIRCSQPSLLEKKRATLYVARFFSPNDR